MRGLSAGKSKGLAECCAGRSYCLFRASMKIRAAPRTFLFAACNLSSPYFSTVLTLPYEPGNWRVLENPRFVLRQDRYSSADEAYSDDKDRLREHFSLQVTAPSARRNQALQLRRQE